MSSYLCQQRLAAPEVRLLNIYWGDSLLSNLQSAYPSVLVNVLVKSDTFWRTSPTINIKGQIHEKISACPWPPFSWKCQDFCHSCQVKPSLDVMIMRFYEKDSWMSAIKQFTTGWFGWWNKKLNRLYGGIVLKRGHQNKAGQQINKQINRL